MHDRYWEEGTIALARAIIAQAMEDYREARRTLRRRPRWRAARERMAETEDFLRSGWLVRLAGLDGAAILEELEEEAG